MLDYVYFVFETAALVSLLIQYKRITTTPYKYFLPFLIIIITYEVASVYELFVINHTNAYITNVAITFEFLFYSNFLIVLLDKKLRARLRIIIAGVFLFTLIDTFLIQGFWNLCSVAILLQYLVLIVLVCMFFNQLMYSGGKQLNLIKLPGFWVNTGLLFFCLAEFLFFAAFTYMAAKKNYNYATLWVVISNMANLILYSCLTISFVCFSKIRKLSY